MNEIDKNMIVSSDFNEPDTVFYNVKNKPFNLYGFAEKEIGKPFARMDAATAKTVSQGVYSSNFWTAGGRVKFKTNSPYVIVSICPPGIIDVWPQMSPVSVKGCDMYEKIDGKEVYAGTFIPPLESKAEYQQILRFSEEGMHDITINMPTYAPICEMYVGLHKDAIVSEGSGYNNEKPFVFYGSSITQGGCMARPGMIYENILSRKYNIDYINLGFAGNAKAEDEIAAYISNLDMSVFIYDYDYNTPSIEHLEKTHERMFKTIREKQPNLPIIIMSAVSGMDREYMKKRRDVVFKTYQNAKNNKDENVYFIDGLDLFEKYGYGWGEPTLEGVHPTDLGFSLMARAIGEVLEKENLV